MENWLINLGLSFTWSKLLPYIFFSLIGFLLAWFLSKRFQNNILKGLFFILFPAITFGIYFAINPIYEGDFSNESYLAKTDLPFPKTTTLSVISLPHCPYCLASIKEMKKMADRGVKIQYLILSDEKADSVRYAKQLAGKISCHLISRKYKLLDLTRGSFPTFVLSNKDGIKKIWSNDHFGVVARDEVCSAFN